MPSAYDDLDRPPLNAAALRRSLISPGSLWTSIDVVAETPSTNAVLARSAASGSRSGTVFITEHQTAGRGRLDRVWTAPARSGLTMSMLVRPHDVALPSWPWIPLLTGLAVAAAVRQHAHVPAGVKWPNDVVVGDRKLAGVLVERVESEGHPPAAVIGIGLNVSMRADELPVPSATSLALESAKTTDRTVLARAILRVLEGLLGEWQRCGGDAADGLHTAYVDACTTIGRRVSVLLPDDRSVEGEAAGIDDAGRLLVRSPRGLVAVSAGDVLHLRRLP
jgi:BirA family biotin operon repressor/biotin-[acetyl-CoA-carboxylase] ligase